MDVFDASTGELSGSPTRADDGSYDVEVNYMVVGYLIRGH